MTEEKSTYIPGQSVAEGEGNVKEMAQENNRSNGSALKIVGVCILVLFAAGSVRSLVKMYSPAKPVDETMAYNEFIDKALEHSRESLPIRSDDGTVFYDLRRVNDSIIFYYQVEFDVAEMGDRDVFISALELDFKELKKYVTIGGSVRFNVIFNYKGPDGAEKQYVFSVPEIERLAQ